MKSIRVLEIPSGTLLEGLYEFQKIFVNYFSLTAISILIGFENL